jgi:hypothetical protein
MPLSWNEIKTRAVAFSNKWKDEESEDAEAKSFWDDFFNVFGISRRRVATFEQWDKTFGGTDDDEFGSIQQTSDLGYVLGGSSTSSISGDKSENSKGYNDYWVVKINANGVEEWDKTLGGANQDLLSSVQETKDGGYILGGSSASGVSDDKSENNKGNYDCWVVKLGNRKTLYQDSATILPSTITEGNIGKSAMFFTIMLGKPATKKCSVHYETYNISAKIGTDYQKAKGTITFEQGQVLQLIEVNVFGDKKAE